MNPPPRNTFHHVKASTQYKREHKADYGREQIEILYEDKDIVVINKPTGLLSVPYPGSKARTALDLLEKIMRSRGTFSAGQYSMLSTHSSLFSGSMALSKLMTRLGCLPKTFLKVRSALGFKYFAIVELF